MCSILKEDLEKRMQNAFEVGSTVVIECAEMLRELLNDYDDNTGRLH